MWLLSAGILQTFLLMVRNVRSPDLDKIPVSCCIVSSGRFSTSAKLVVRFSKPGIGKLIVGPSCHQGCWESERGEIHVPLCDIRARQGIYMTFWLSSDVAVADGSPSRVTHWHPPALLAVACLWALLGMDGDLVDHSKSSLIYLPFREYHALLWVHLPLSVSSFYFFYL